MAVAHISHKVVMCDATKGKEEYRQRLIFLNPRTLAADRSVYASWPLAAGCHTIDYYY